MIPLGNSSSYGVKAAAQDYFGKDDLNELTLAGMRHAGRHHQKPLEV